MGFVGSPFYLLLMGGIRYSSLIPTHARAPSCEYVGRREMQDTSTATAHLGGKRVNKFVLGLILKKKRRRALEGVWWGKEGSGGSGG